MKVEKELLLLVQNKSNISSLFLFCILLFLPTQLGFHFWPSWAFVNGARVDYLSPTFYVTDIFIAGLFLSVFFTNQLRFSKNTVITLAVILVATLPGILLSVFPFAGWYMVGKILEFFFVGWYIAGHPEKTVTYLFAALPFGLFVESVLAIWQFVTQGSVGGVLYYLGERTFSASTPGIANAAFNGSLVLRPYGTFSHPNVLAGYLVIGLLFLFLFFNDQIQIIKIFWFGIELVVLIALVATLSRSALIVVAVMFLFFIFERTFKKGKTKELFYWSGISVLFAALLYPRFATLFVGEAVVLREQLAVASLKMFQNAPLFGVGLQNFFMQLPKLTPNIPLQPVHNVFLLALSETGIVGVALFVILLILTIKRVFQSSFESQLKKNIRIFCLFSLGIFLSIGLVDHYFFTLQQGQILTSLIFGLSWSSEKN